MEEVDAERIPIVRTKRVGKGGCRLLLRVCFTGVDICCTSVDFLTKAITDDYNPKGPAQRILADISGRVNGCSLVKG